MPLARLRAWLPAAALLACSAPPLPGQVWNSQRALELARRAIERRSTQISAAVLAGYSAKATGYLTFLYQIGDTALFSPKVVKQTRIATEVYWKAPASSKQVVVGLQDTLLIPGDIGYYQDRFGIIQSNFVDRIRLGDGKDVADVVHPFGPTGLDAYDFAVVDSTTYNIGRDTIDVIQLAYRPRDPLQPRAVGNAYLDVRNADIVRLDVSFTRSALLDPRNEHVSVVLENQLVEGRVWLPRRQQIEVQRATTWLEIGIRGIIRGRWDVCCYDVKFVPPPERFAGPPIVFAPPDQLRKYPFEGKILDALPPDVAAVRPEDVERVQKEAESMVAKAFRQRVQPAALSIPSISDIVRVTRAEGVAIGAAGKLHPTTLFGLDARVRYGFSDAQWKGELGGSFDFDHGRTLRLFGLRDYRDVRDVAEVSGVRNTIASQEFGSDYTDPVDLRSYGASISLGRWAHARWRVEAAHEQQDPLAVRATPENGSYEPTISARPASGTRVSIRAEGATYTVFGGALHATSELRITDLDGKAARLSLNAEYTHALGSTQIASRTVAVALTEGALPPQLYVYFGGPTTAPGYEFTDFAARRGVSERVEWRADIPFPPISLARFGHIPAHATLAPYVQAVWVDDPARVGAINTPPEPTPSSLVRTNRQGWYPALGVGLEPILGLMRIDVARGLRDGRWTFGVDLAPSLWPIF